MSRYAEGTVVSVGKTRAEIETLVEKYGATEFSSGWMGTLAAIQFFAKGRRVRFELSLPNDAWGVDAIFNRKHARYWNRAHVPAGEAKKVADAETRRRWRCLLLAIKAKLEVVETGISTFDEEFLAHIVVDDKTVYQRMTEAIGNGRPMLPPVGGDS